VRKGIGAERWTIRFTPRKPRSIRSAVNIKRIGELTEQGRMQPAGLKVFAERDQQQSKQNAYKNKDSQLDAAYLQQLQQDAQAWAYFQTNAPSYQHPAGWWVMSAQKEEMRLSRLQTLITGSREGKTVPYLTRPQKQEKGK
jgi:uncharacterized protein YdeI (YjbR/CyaY-like superfamily)